MPTAVLLGRPCEPSSEISNSTSQSLFRPRAGRRAPRARACASRTQTHEHHDSRSRQFTHLTRTHVSTHSHTQQRAGHTHDTPPWVPPSADSTVSNLLSCVGVGPPYVVEPITWRYTLNNVSSTGSTHSPHRASLHEAPKARTTDSKPETDIFECALLTSCLRPVVIGVQRAPVSRQRHPRPWLLQRPSTQRQAASGP